MNMVSPPEQPATPLQARFVADAGLAGRMASASLAARLTRVQNLTSWGLLIVFATVAGAVIGNLVGLVVGAMVFLGVLTWLTYRASIRVYRRGFPVRSIHTSEFGADSMTVTGPLGSSEIRYVAFEKYWATPRALVLRMRGTAAVMTIPGELVPAGAVELLRAKLKS